MKFSLLGILLMLVSFAQAENLSKKELLKYKNNELLKAPNITLVAGKKLEGDYALIKGYFTSKMGDITPVEVITNNKLVITGGTAFDVNTKKPIKLEFDYAKFKKDAAFTIGNGKKELFLFTEAECPYCEKFEDEMLKLNKDYKLYVFMFPLEQIHYFAKAMSIATLSQPINQRYAYYKKLMKLNSKNKIELIKEISKYSADLYKKVVFGLNTFGNSKAAQRSSQMAQRYLKFIEQVNGESFASRKEAIDFCNNKIREIELNQFAPLRIKAEKILEKQKVFASGYLSVNGTPSLFDMNGNKIDNIYMIFK